MIIPIRKRVVISTVLIAAVIVIAIGLYFWFTSTVTLFRTGAVVSNGIGCAEIGRNILVKGGSFADSAIATLFCEGLANPQSMGIGGGFLATIYIKSTGFAETLIAREMAPLAASEGMFTNKSIEGGISVAVPGEIKGYYALHQKYGILPWKELIAPTIKLCEEGHEVSVYLATKLREKEKKILNAPTLKEIFIDPNTGKVYKQGDKIRRTKLAETLKVIAEEGETAMYNGTIGKMLVQDIQSFGGIITEEDLKQYRVRWRQPATSDWNGYTVHSSPLPGSGSVLTFILNLIENHITNDTALSWHRVVEAFKHGYGQRTQLGDIEFLPNDIKELASQLSTQEFADKIYERIKDNETFSSFEYYGANFSTPDDYGTANIAVLAPNGDAITVTSTINMIFGAMIVSNQTGIILNNEMDDFSTPGIINGFGLSPSKSNFIKPKKMPLSSMCPTIILDEKKNLRLLIGAAGGSKITTSVAQTIIRHLLFKENLYDAIQAKRLHHQLSPMVVQHEVNYDRTILDSLRERGHILAEIPPENGFSALTAVYVDKSEVAPVFDSRRPGSTAVWKTSTKLLPM